jgi:hypothetical protein
MNEGFCSFFKSSLFFFFFCKSFLLSDEFFLVFGSLLGQISAAEEILKNNRKVEVDEAD